jgi:hypothetical protein
MVFEDALGGIEKLSTGGCPKAVVPDLGKKVPGLRKLRKS